MMQSCECDVISIVFTVNSTHNSLLS